MYIMLLFVVAGLQPQYSTTGSHRVCYNLNGLNEPGDKIVLSHFTHRYKYTDGHREQTQVPIGQYPEAEPRAPELQVDLDEDVGLPAEPTTGAHADGMHACNVIE